METDQGSAEDCCEMGTPAVCMCKHASGGDTLFLSMGDPVDGVPSKFLPHGVGAELRPRNITGAQKFWWFHNVEVEPLTPAPGAQDTKTCPNPEPHCPVCHSPLEQPVQAQGICRGQHAHQLVHLQLHVLPIEVLEGHGEAYGTPRPPSALTLCPRPQAPSLLDTQG